MRLIELLDTAIKTGDIICIEGWRVPIKDWHLGMRYNKENDCFVWCNPVSGEFDKLKANPSDYHKVILSSKILNLDGWMLVPLHNNYKIGDKFLLNTMKKVITENGICITEKVIEKPIGEIISISPPREDDGFIYFTLKIDDDFGTIILGEHSIKKYPRVINQ